MKPLAEIRLARILGEILRLEWEYESAALLEPDKTLTDGAALAATCPAGELETFRDRIALGQLMAIQHWAQGMADRYPEQEAVWQDILRLCGLVDLPGLRRLAEAWGEAARASTSS